jgi:hypothetical protein
MQGGLALLGGLAGASVWWETDQQLWLVGAILMLLNWPYTVLFILPTNRKLEATAPHAANVDTRDAITHWGRLHAGRTILGALAAAAYAAAAAL